MARGVVRAAGAGGWAVLAAAALMLTLGPEATGSTHEWTVAAYLSGDGDLRAAAHRYLEMVARGTDRPGWAAAVQLDETDADGRCLASRHLWLWEDGQRKHVSESVPGGEAGVNMGARETLGEFLGWVREQAPAQRYALIIMGHGTGLAVPGGGLEGGLANSGVALDTSAGGDCLSAVELAGGIEDGFGEGEAPGLDALFLDCCYGGCLEVAYELRDAARYLTGAPGEMPNPGLPWDTILSSVSGDGEVEGRELVETCLRVAQEQDGEQTERVSLTAIDLNGMSSARQSFREYATAAAGRMAEIAPAVTLAHSRSATWGSQRELCDAGVLLESLAECLADDGLARAARAAAEAVKASVVGRAGEQGEQGVGIGIFFPGALSGVPASYEPQRCSFARDSGWGAFLRAYLHRLRDLMERKAEREDTDGSGAAVQPPVVKAVAQET